MIRQINTEADVVEAVREAIGLLKEVRASEVPYFVSVAGEAVEGHQDLVALVEARDLLDGVVMLDDLRRSSARRAEREAV